MSRSTSAPAVRIAIVEQISANDAGGDSARSWAAARVSKDAPEEVAVAQNAALVDAEQRAEKARVDEVSLW